MVTWSKEVTPYVTFKALLILKTNKDVYNDITFIKKSCKETLGKISIVLIKIMCF